MRTLLLAPALFSSEGGIERMMRVYAQALSELNQSGDQLHLAALNDSKIPSKRLAPYVGKRHGEIICGDRNKLLFAARVLWLVRKVDRIICGHFHLLPLLDLAKRLNPSLTISVVAHGTEIWRSWTAKEKLMARRSVKFLSVSEYTRKIILQQCPQFDPEHITIVPNSFDPNLVSQDAIPSSRVPGRILAVARLSSGDSYKGVDHLIEAMPKIKSNSSGAHLRIIGKGDDRPRLERLAVANGCESIEFGGFVPDKDLPSEYQKASLFALPSRDEGFGLVYLEAFKHGTPVVVAAAGAAPEVITPDCGVSVPYGNVELLAETCSTALATKWDKALIQQRAEKFNYSNFKNRLREVLSAPITVPQT